MGDTQSDLREAVSVKKKKKNYINYPTVSVWNHLKDGC